MNINKQFYGLCLLAMATKLYAAAPRTQLPQNRQPNRTRPVGFLPLVPPTRQTSVTSHAVAEPPTNAPLPTQTQPHQRQDTTTPPEKRYTTQHKTQAAQEKAALDAARLAATEVPEETFEEYPTIENVVADSVSRRTMQRSKQRREDSIPAPEIVDMGEITNKTTATLEEEIRRLQRSRPALNSDDLPSPRLMDQPTQEEILLTSKQPVFNIEPNLESQADFNAEPISRRTRAPKALESEATENNILLHHSEF